MKDLRSKFKEVKVFVQDNKSMLEGNKKYIMSGVVILCLSFGYYFGHNSKVCNLKGHYEEINKVSELESTIEDNNAVVSENDELIATLQAKVKDAKPWFDMKQEEQNKIKEENDRIEKEKLEQQKKEQEEKEKNKYNTDVSYDKINRNPEETLMKNCKFNGKVVQVMEGADKNNLRVAVDGDYDKIILVEYSKDLLDSRIVEKDNVTLYGVSCGTTSYTSTFGASITIPSMLADKIDIN